MTTTFNKERCRTELRRALRTLGKADTADLIAEADIHKMWPEVFEELKLAPPKWLLQRQAAERVPAKKCFFYLVTFVEYGVPVWKWGITTKADAKARCSTYVDTHRWIEIPSMAVGRQMEKMMGCLMTVILFFREPERSMYRESVDQYFSFDVLLKALDWMLANVDEKGRWSEAANEMYAIACPRGTGAPDMAPPVALALREEMEAALIKPEVKELEPMWA